MKNNTITTKTTTKNNTTMINTTRTTKSADLSTIFTTTTFSSTPTITNLPTFNDNPVETIDIAGQIINQTQQEITSSAFFIPIVGLLFALIPIFVFCLCQARCWRKKGKALSETKKPKSIV